MTLGCLGSVCPPVDYSTLCSESTTLYPYHLPFGSSLSATFGLFMFTRFIDSSHVLTMHPRLVPYRVLLSDIPSASRLRCVGYIVRRASDHLLVACLRSLRLKVQPVCLMALSVISNNHHCDFVSRSSIHPFFPITFQPAMAVSATPDDEKYFHGKSCLPH